jgi:hypothetical protein
MTTFFKPFIWEASNPLMLLNGIENLLFLGLFLQFIRQLITQRKVSITQYNLIVFSFVFVLLMAFFVGITSGLFGVLVRMKAGTLVFFLIFLFSKSEETISQPN